MFSGFPWNPPTTLCYYGEQLFSSLWLNATNKMSVKDHCGSSLLRAFITRREASRARRRLTECCRLSSTLLFPCITIMANPLFTLTIQSDILTCGEGFGVYYCVGGIHIRCLHRKGAGVHRKADVVREVGCSFTCGDKREHWVKLNILSIFSEQTLNLFSTSMFPQCLINHLSTKSHQYFLNKLSRQSQLVNILSMHFPLS